MLQPAAAPHVIPSQQACLADGSLARNSWTGCIKRDVAPYIVLQHWCLTTATQQVACSKQLPCVGPSVDQIRSNGFSEPGFTDPNGVRTQSVLRLVRSVRRRRQCNEVRGFKLAAGRADEYAFMLAADYREGVRRTATALRAQRSPPPAAQTAALDWFLDSVVPSCREVRSPLPPIPPKSPPPSKNPSNIST